MDELVSIVIPAYNAEAFIADTLDSILKQTYPHVEVVIVNDGSTDNTLDIISGYAKKDERIRVFSQKNGGVSAARNTALQHVRGTYLTYVDSDDTVPSTALSDMVALMKDDVDMVVASHNDVHLKKKAYIEKVRTFTPQQIQDEFIEFDSVMWWPWAKLFRTSIIKENGLSYDTTTTFGEDHIFNLLYARYIKNKITVTDKIVYDYHYIRGGICSKYYPNMHLMQKQILVAIADFFGGKDVMPYEYKSYFTGAYTRGRVEYYAAWLSPKKAAVKIDETLAAYSDYLDDNILRQFFTETQVDFLKNKQFYAFTRNYIIKNPRRTLWRKGRRYVRRFLELQQRIFLKRK